MSIDKSLRRKGGMSRNRSVLTRGERIKVLKETDRWTDGQNPYGLPKVRVMKISAKKAPKKEKAEGEAGAAPAADAKAPAGGKAPAAAAAKAPAGKAPAGKADAKGGKK